MKPANESEMLNRMAAYCSAVERCVSDVRKKVADAGLTAEAGERITAALLKAKFIDEQRFARSFVHDKLRLNNWGRIKIAYELRCRNIPPDICSDALGEIDEQDYMSILLSVLEKKKKSLHRENEREAFAKLLRFAAGRGFENSETVRCLNQLFRST
ncbi:MAG: RecX family transcriptional regulator [Tannerellaceae bacterium]|jgi:regulatory protein|nr:RecX family transcriptional regulator [Tannerellaceae bacterium]